MHETSMALWMAAARSKLSSSAAPDVLASLSLEKADLLDAEAFAATPAALYNMEVLA